MYGDTTMSQMEAALNAVRTVGLNQKLSVQREWFSDAVRWEMFERRLGVLLQE